MGLARRLLVHYRAVVTLLTTWQVDKLRPARPVAGWYNAPYAVRETSRMR